MERAETGKKGVWEREDSKKVNAAIVNNLVKEL